MSRDLPLPRELFTPAVAAPTVSPARTSAEWRRFIVGLLPSAEPAMVVIAASLLANPNTSSDTLLVVADALREVADHMLASGQDLVAGSVILMADVVAAEAPGRAG